MRNYKAKEHINLPEKAFSIIIAAKNEEENIARCLNKLLAQKYNDYEIIIINDHSSDKTSQIIKSFNSKKVALYDNGKNYSGKKSAIELGISKANNEYLAFIDADCEPTSEYWLSELNKSFFPSKKIVLGHGRFVRTNGFLNKLIRYESLLNAIQYFSHSLNGNPYMGVGRNMAYTKSLFGYSRGFDNHKNIKSGDDDLFVNENSNKQNTIIMTNNKSHTLSKSAKNFKEYFFQKRRHLQAGTKYRINHKVILGIYGFSQLLFSVLFMLLLLTQFEPLIILFIFLIKELIQLYIIKDICNELKDKDLILWKPLLEGLYIILITGIGVSTWVWKVDRWK